ncbi:hypothetical protein ACWD25_27540 [Streptomyces sp. NPDC002920]
MPVLHWWFVTAPLFLLDKLGEGGIVPRAGTLVLLAGYALLTLLAAVWLLVGVAKVCRSIVRGAGVRAGRAGR